MFLTEEILKRLAGASVTFIEREDLPLEARFKKQLYPHFTKEEAESRALAIASQCPDVNAVLSPLQGPYWAKEIGKSPTAIVKFSREEGTNNKALALSREIFGDLLEAERKNFSEIFVRAIIIPDSPALSLNQYWSAYTKLENVDRPSKTLTPICLLHEIGHLHFPFSTDDLSEAMADRFALSTYREIGGSESDIQDFISMRRMSAFIDSSPHYWTAAAGGEKMYGSYLPPVAQIRKTMHELKDRVLYNLEKPESDVREQAIRRRDKANAQKAFEKYQIPDVMAALKRVVEGADELSCPAREEGNAIIKAYQSFCPHEDAKPIPFYAQRFKGLTAALS